MQTKPRQAIHHLAITCMACLKDRASVRRHITDGPLELNPCLCNTCDTMTDTEVLNYFRVGPEND